MYLKVIDNPDLVRNSSTKAILNNNIEQLENYKKKRERDRKIFKLEKDVTDLRGDIGEIKQMMHELLMRGK